MRILMSGPWVVTDEDKDTVHRAVLRGDATGSVVERQTFKKTDKKTVIAVTDETKYLPSWFASSVTAFTELVLRMQKWEGHSGLSFAPADHPAYLT